jgi:hypothetical protein
VDYCIIMPTQNPKISAYVPQIVYDKFKQYEKEQGVSMSQAVIELLSNYFGIDLSSYTIKSTGGLQSRLEFLENEFTQMKTAFTKLSEEVDRINFISSSPEKNKFLEEDPEIHLHKSSDIKPEVVEISSNIENNFEQHVSQGIANYTDLKLDLLKSESASQTSLKNEPLFRLQSELPDDIANKNIDDAIAPLKISEIAERFGLSQAMLNKASKYPIDKQIEYTASKDKDQRPWVYSQSKKRFYPLRKPE